ncbi:unnamed protein product [Orchesella dallaii]|uniref:Integrase catalytic domain-containing protein n=1 Tax=Orchesella dallaii TaxID=48710 RepID=A0ABP1R433_9HEXA
MVLSQLARVFDPLGLITPVTINAKLFMQLLWKNEVHWDEKLPNALCKEWRMYIEQLNDIDKIHIPRWIQSDDESVTFTQLHAFSDASERAYGAVVYARNVNQNGKCSVFMLASKSRVAPLKQISLPRLELCGAVLATELLTSIRRAICLECEVFCWTDSMIVLQWLASHPRRWQTFVANRVSLIQVSYPFQNWNHVKGSENPADLISRGTTAVELCENQLWWNGPHWLSAVQLPARVIITEKRENPALEERKITVHSSHVEITYDFTQRYSTLTKLTRVVAYMFRFLSNCKNKLRNVDPLSPHELDRATTAIIYNVQIISFCKDYNSLLRLNKLSATSKLNSLNPFLDGNGIIRVGGRVEKSDLPSNQKHPIIIPHNHHFTSLLINQIHLTLSHGGNKLVWCYLRTKYWLINARNTIRFILRKCTVCRRHRSDGMKQLMGSLPSPRVNPGRTFLNCGVDYAGPFNLRLMKGRRNRLFKAYFCVFICMATKAVHLEAVSELTTEAFLATFKRFIARRGAPMSMHSDCGTNFVGANKELKQLLQSNDHNIAVADNLSSQLISWHFNAPSAPHQGGIWEAGVKSVKFHLSRVIGTQSLTFEEFSTVLCQVEACMNSRPLCSMTSDPDDNDALTPGHFLIGSAMTTIPSPDITTIKVNRLSRWQLTQRIIQDFWRRWSNEYVTTLQQRWKWQNKTENIKTGDLVLVHDELLPPAKWKLARVIETHIGHDNLVRTVTIKTMTGTFKRPIVKLTPLLSVDEPSTL